MGRLFIAVLAIGIVGVVGAQSAPAASTGGSSAENAAQKEKAAYDAHKAAYDAQRKIASDAYKKADDCIKSMSDQAIKAKAAASLKHSFIRLKDADEAMKAAKWSDASAYLIFVNDYALAALKICTDAPGHIPAGAEPPSRIRAAAIRMTGDGSGSIQAELRGGAARSGIEADPVRIRTPAIRMTGDNTPTGTPRKISESESPRPVGNTTRAGGASDSPPRSPGSASPRAPARR